MRDTCKCYITFEMYDYIDGHVNAHNIEVYLFPETPRSPKYPALINSGGGGRGGR